MSTFASSFAEFAGGRLADHFGESVTYTPASGSASTIRAILTRQQVETIGNMGDGAYAYSVTAWLRKADVPTLTIRKDTIAFKVNTWDAATVTRAIQECIEQTADMYLVRLQ